MQNVFKKSFFILILFSAFLMSGCVGFGPKPLKQLSLVGTDKQNPDVSGSALPTHVKVYQLKSYEALINLSFNDFAQGNDENQLGGSLISATGHVIDPGRSMALSPLLEKDTEYVGFTALFRKPDPVQWKAIAKRKDLNGEKVFLQVENCYVRIVNHKGKAFKFKPFLKDRPEAEKTRNGFKIPDCGNSSTSTSYKNGEIPVLNPEDVSPAEY